MDKFQLIGFTHAARIESWLKDRSPSTLPMVAYHGPHRVAIFTLANGVELAERGDSPQFEGTVVEQEFGDVVLRPEVPTLPVPVGGAQQRAGAPDAAVAAIEFALTQDYSDGMDFLRFWNEGDFDVLRADWPEAPEAVYIGADPLHPETKRLAAAPAPKAREPKFTTECSKCGGGAGQKKVCDCAVKAQQRAGVPDGWKLVPAEPTPEMLEAWEGVKGQQSHPHWYAQRSKKYRVMLAAAPAPKAQEQCAHFFTPGIRNSQRGSFCLHCAAPQPAEVGAIPDFEAVRNKRMSELSPEEQRDARELWVREQLGWFAGSYAEHVKFLLERLDEARAQLTEGVKEADLLASALDKIREQHRLERLQWIAEKDELKATLTEGAAGEFRKGNTNAPHRRPKYRDDFWIAGIDHPERPHVIECYGNTPAEVETLRDRVLTALTTTAVGRRDRIEVTPAMEAAAEKWWNERRFKAFSDDPRTWKGLIEAALEAASQPAQEGDRHD